MPSVTLPGAEPPPVSRRLGHPPVPAPGDTRDDPWCPATVDFVPEGVTLEMRLIEILGAGCPRCGHLEIAAREAVFRSGQTAEIRRVTDFAEISARGLMGLPGLVIDGRAVCAGRVPTVAEIEGWLGEEPGFGAVEGAPNEGELARR